MNFNLKKHKTLELLSESRIKFETDLTASKKYTWGVSFEELQNQLGYERDKCELVFSELYDNEEIKPTDVEVLGLIATRKGLTAFANKKYKRENNRILINWAKNFVQIIIPVLALVVAILSFSLKLNNIKIETDKNFQKIMTTVLEEKHRLDRIEQKVATDSIKQKKPHLNP